MTIKQVRYFLEKCVQEGDIVWEKSKGGGYHCANGTVKGTVRVTVSGTVSGTVSSTITLCNYDKYQPNGNSDGHGECNGEGTVMDCANGTILEEGKKEERTKKKNRSTRPSKPVASHDVEKLQEILSGINMAEFDRKYGPQGLDIFTCFDDFTDYVLNGSAKDPRPNPAKWTDFSRAFHDSCKRALRDGRHLCKTETKKELSLAERLAQREWK